jgi:phosphoenolpyruvate carboxylase
MRAWLLTKELTGGEAARHAAPDPAYTSTHELLVTWCIIEASFKSHHGEALHARDCDP